MERTNLFLGSDRSNFLLLHGVAFVLHVISGSLAWSLVPRKEDRLIWLGTPNTTLVKAVGNESLRVELGLNKEHDDLDVTTFVVANEFLTASSHLIGIWWWMNAEGQESQQKRHGYSRTSEYMRRWPEYAVTAGLLEIAILMANGERSVVTVMLFFMLNVALQLCGYNMDASVRVRSTGDENSAQAKPRIVYANLFAGFAILAVQIATVALYRAGMTIPEGVDDAFTAVLVAYTLFYLSFGLHQTLVHTSKWYRDLYDGDKVFVFLSITSKICISWIMLARTRKVLLRAHRRKQNTGICPPLPRRALTNCLNRRSCSSTAPSGPSGGGSPKTTSRRPRKGGTILRSS